MKISAALPIVRAQYDNYTGRVEVDAYEERPISIVGGQPMLLNTSLDIYGLSKEQLEQLYLQKKIRVTVEIDDGTDHAG